MSRKDPLLPEFLPKSPSHLLAPPITTATLCPRKWSRHAQYLPPPHLVSGLLSFACAPDCNVKFLSEGTLALLAKLSSEPVPMLEME